ncbi:MAG: hypothetical protein M3P52_02630 [Actinomycetota bacterium]|nr:hypothetical protein [Actinomycetota bacterium]
MARVMIIGTGDMGDRFAAGLAASGRVRELLLTDVSSELSVKAATLASSYDCIVRAESLDARRQRDVEAVLRRAKPDLVVQAASLQSPWALVDRDDPVARAIAAAGLGLRLPLQLSVLLTVMRAVGEVGYQGPVANISLPDLTHPILHMIGLAPTVGLGNVSMQLLRVRAALRAERGPSGELPLLRLVGHHHHVYDVMQSTPPADPASGPIVWVGEQGERRDELAYKGPSIAPSIRYNAVTAAAALPVLLALLPEAEPLRWSTPAPFGLAGGYPVRIANGHIDLDLPPGVELEDCIAHCRRAGRGDGVERIDDEGTIHFTDQARASVLDVAPDIAEPLPLTELQRRAERILALLG